MRGRKRKLPMNKESVKLLKKVMKDCKNTVEQQRVNIMIVYLWGKNISETTEILWVSSWTVQSTINKYIKNKDNFHKTKYKGKIETKKRIELKSEVKEFIEKNMDEWEHIDVNTVLRKVNKKYWEEVIDYHGMWWIIRKWFWYNYQKPFVRNKKQSEHSEKIFKGRFTKAVIKVWIEEKDIDAYAIKNKKTKFGKVIDQNVNMIYRWVNVCNITKDMKSDCKEMRKSWYNLIWN